MNEQINKFLPIHSPNGDIRETSFLDESLP